MLFAGTLLIFSILPILNYSIDQRRVLHNDYKNAYKGIPINKPFLKLNYLLDNKEKYDTLFMGSSRNASLDTRLVSSHSYNMYYEFGVIAAHLHNLKILLENQVKIKSLWLGINDFDIWKNPEDHEMDYSKKTYKDNFIDKVDFYSLYLLKKIENNDIQILMKKNHLTESNRILQERDSAYEKKLKDKEEKRLANPDIWINKMTSTAGMMLGYNDKDYRIDNTIKEVEEIKKLCDKYNVELTVFMYPSFYKTYLQYNQYKIEEFKRKLSSIVDFHDFYNLNHIALNELSWTDSSHFSAKVGRYIVENIFQNNFLVTKDTINARIKKTRTSIRNIINKTIPIKYIHKFNAHMDFHTLTPIFDIKESQYKFTKNNQFTLENKGQVMMMKSNNTDPSLVLNTTKSNSENVILTYKVECTERTIFQVYYKNTPTSAYSEKDAFRVHLREGLNEFSLRMPSAFINNQLRVDLASTVGVFKIKEFLIYGIE